MLCSKCHKDPCKLPGGYIERKFLCSDCHPRGRGRNIRSYEFWMDQKPELAAYFKSLGVSEILLKRMYYEILLVGMTEASSIFGDAHDWDGRDEDTHLCYGVGGYIGERRHELWLNELKDLPKYEELIDE